MQVASEVFGILFDCMSVFCIFMAATSGGILGWVAAVLFGAAGGVLTWLGFFSE
ncbi:MAG TPA: hypothetical protein PLI09_26115 [Candidatus Hydrogenedentes bacterium]|nr:hypothetical protein [Candidatus Hydrogenedentota bacterium]